MAFREQILSRIKRKEAEIQGHETKIREAKVYIQALQDVLKTLPITDSSAEEVSASPEAILRPGSMVYKTYELLSNVGKPLHISAILEGIGEEPTRQKKASLVSSLATYVKNQQIFDRPLPNTFGLIGMACETNKDEPPDDFGVTEDDDDIPL